MGGGVATALDPSLPLPELVAQRARVTPDLPFIEEIGGSSLTYGQAHADALRWAGALRRLGVSEGDTVPVLLPSTAAALHVWLGVAALGAIELPVNPDLTAALIADVLRAAPSRVVVVGRKLLGTLVDALEMVAREATVVVTDGAGDATRCSGVDVVDAITVVHAGSAIPEQSRHTSRRRDLSCVIWTSGTTGPSKGTLVTWAQLAAMAAGSFPVEEMHRDDCFYLYFPLHYVGGRMAVHLMAACGGRIAIRERFSTDSFLTDVMRYRCTHAALNPAMCYFLLARPPSPDDATSTLRDVLLAPVIPEVESMCSRFGWRWRTAYNSTETSAPIVSGWNPTDLHSCGRVRRGYEVRVAGEDDEALPPGEVGELLVRTDRPWTLMQGYFGRPDDTVRSWRNQWFHTGDAFIYDAEGNYFFVDRLKDTIRRRSQNISSFEVELAVGAHPAVETCAVVPVKSEWGEEEVRAVVTVRPGHRLEPAALVEFCAGRLARHMLPRFVDIVGDLPRTVSHKVNKAAVRSMPLLPTTWDATMHRPRRTS